MKVNLTEFAARGKQEIAKRLADFRKNAPETGPMIGAPNIKYEGSQRDRAVGCGGIGVVHSLVAELKLAAEIDRQVPIFKIHNPYFESDHVLNIAYNAVCNGDALGDIELRRQDSAFLDAIGAVAIPDPTTAGDFCRRFDDIKIWDLMGVFNQTRAKIWRAQSESFRKTALIDVDGIIVPTLGEKKEGMDISYKGTWGYHPLLVSLANTREPLYLINRPGNQPSHAGSIKPINAAIDLCRSAGFENIRVRGDTDFSLTKNFDAWDKQGVTFVFGFDAKAGLIELAEFLPDDAYEELIREFPYEVKTKPRATRANIKEEIVKLREFKNIKLVGEQLAEFPYQPVACEVQYRVIVLRKDISVAKGEQVLFPEVRYFFYITNDRHKSAEEIVLEANDRCNQENLGAQLKGGVHALRAPLDTLNSNWAFMVMTSLAWSLKAWLGLTLLAKDEASLSARHELLRMEFKRFVNSVILIPCQIVKTGRRMILRALSWRPGIEILACLTVALNC